MTANTTYVTSVYSSAGFFAFTPAFFATGVDNGPLHALANSVSANGVYRYGAGGGFPTSTYNSSNYWADVVYRRASDAP